MASLRWGIVGLPNVGKSTLFSALSGMQVPAENFPFCTKDPNIAMVEVPDPRMKTLAQLVPTQRVVPVTVEFVDIAGLIRGASKGEGLGNQFLGNIRNVDAILQVIRCFEASDVVHVEGEVNPLKDYETISLELAFADFEVLERRLAAIEKKVKGQDKEAKEVHPILQKIKKPLEKGEPLRNLSLREDEKNILKPFNFLTLKPQIFVPNISEKTSQKEQGYLQVVEELGKKEQVEVVPICGKLEAEIAELGDEEREEFLKEMNLKERGLNRLIRSAYHLLHLRTFFTVGPKEIHAWTFKEGSLAPEAAGKIHTDFEKGFIRAETYHYDDLVKLKSEKAIKEAGKMRMEGKDYPVQDGDIMLFHFSN